MQVIKVGRDLDALGDVAVVLVLGTGDGIGLAEALGLLEGFVRPDSGIEVSRLLLEEVHRDIEEFEAGAAAEEEHFVPFGNIEELLPESPAFVHCGFPLFGAV